MKLTIIRCEDQFEKEIKNKSTKNELMEEEKMSLMTEFSGENPNKGPHKNPKKGNVCLKEQERKNARST